MFWVRHHGRLPGRLAVMLALASPASALPAPPVPATTPAPAPRAQVDSRGFIDVWALRRDVVLAETRPRAVDKDSCYTERDTEQRLSPKDQAERNSEAQACEQAIVGRHGARALLNTAWLPALMEAVRRGDPVAEVILRQCSTTGLLDRSGIESTCDEVPGRRAIAARRLREIGFAPAFDHAGEASGHGAGRPDTAQAQTLALQRFAHADFSIDHMQTDGGGGNAPRDAAELDRMRNSVLIYSALMEVRRAFTYSLGSWSGSSAFGALTLNRQPSTPGYLTWGRSQFQGGGRRPYTDDWLLGGKEIYIGHEGKRRVLLGGKTDADFVRRLRTVLAAAETSIDQALQRDPRWAVFLIRRVGHHEWVPQGMTTASGRLGSAWFGSWVLRREFVDDARTDKLAPARAQIVPGTEVARIRFEPDPAGGSAASDCELRYSGGLSLVQDLSGGQDATPLGPIGSLSAFEIMQPRERYRQVLVQCPQGEWPLSRTARMLFLTKDTLVEVMSPGKEWRGVRVRHWVRGGGVLQFGVPTAASHVDALAWLAEMQHAAEAAHQDLDGASTKDLIARLAFSRNESLYYSDNDFPENLKVLLRRQGIVGDVVAAYRAKPADFMLRFNLVLVLVQQLKLRVARADEVDLAADELVLALRDAHPWVRTEAVAGLRFAPRARDEAAVRALADDPAPEARRESIGTLAAIRRAAPQSK